MALMAGDQSNSAVNFDMGPTSYNFNQPYGAVPQQTGENEEYELRVCSLRPYFLSDLKVLLNVNRFASS